MRIALNELDRALGSMCGEIVVSMIIPHPFCNTMSRDIDAGGIRMLSV